MNYKFMTVLLILIVVGAGVYFFQNNKKVSEEDLKITNELINDELTVVYNNDGFNPKELKIKKGQTVKFINQSDRKMWVASNDHPAHDLYPEFDQKEITERGTTYEFKFDKPGSWGYHNHMYSNHIGTIIVE